MFGFGFLPPIEPITPLGMKILGIFLSLLYGWSFVSLVWPSLLGMIALSLTGYAPLAGIMKEGFGGNTLLLMWAMLLIAALVDSTIFLMSAISSSVPTIVVGWGILYYILNQSGYKAGNPLSSYMVVGVVYCSTCATALFPWKLLQNIVLGIFANTAGYQIEYSLYIAMTLPLGLAALIGYVLVGKYFFRFDVEKLKLVSEDSFNPEDLKINKYQK